MTKTRRGQHDAALAVALGDIEVDRSNLNEAGDGEVAHDFVQLRPEGIERLARLVAKLLQPWIVQIPVAEQVGAHRAADWKQADIRHPVGGSLGKVSQRRERES